MTGQCQHIDESGKRCIFEGVTYDKVRRGLVCAMHVPLTTPEVLKCDMQEKGTGCQCKTPQVIMAMVEGKWNAICGRCHSSLQKRMNVKNRKEKALHEQYGLYILRCCSHDSDITQAQLAWALEWIRKLKKKKKREVLKKCRNATT